MRLPEQRGVSSPRLLTTLAARGASLDIADAVAYLRAEADPILATFPEQ